MALAVTGRRRSTLPLGITHAQARAILAGCDRRRAIGRRDYAIIVLLLRLGLRRSEVAGLTLDDIDWRAGELVVRGKGSRSDRLPLPADVGQAIAAYLRRGRPLSDRRQVFLADRAPVRPIASGTVASTVRRACRRAGCPRWIASAAAHRSLRDDLGRCRVGRGRAGPSPSQPADHRRLRPGRPATAARSGHPVAGDAER